MLATAEHKVSPQQMNDVGQNADETHKWSLATFNVVCTLFSSKVTLLPPENGAQEDWRISPRY